MSITTIIGPMFSGKTSELIRLIDRKRIADKKCLIIKHVGDTRFDIGTDVYHVTTHSNICYKKCDVLYLSVLDNIEPIVNKYNVVAIDEGFFFVNINDYCTKLASHGIDVIVASLDTSFKQQLFPEIGKLIGNSEILIKLSAICMKCKTADAIFTVRTIESEVEILVGGCDIYQSVCRACLNKSLNIISVA